MGDLSEFDKMYDDAETNNEDFSDIPEGVYQVFVDKVCIKQTKETNLPMMAWKFKITAGPYEGRVLFKNSVIKDKTISYIKTDILICGLKLEKFSDIGSRLREILNMCLDVKVAYKTVNGSKMQNIYIQRKAGETQGSTVSEDDIPF